MAKSALQEIEKSLTAIVGVQKVASMSRDQFVTYASDQIAKAQAETFDASRARLQALQKATAMVSSQFEDESVDSVKVPIYECEQTATKDQETSAMTPDQAASKNPSSGNGAFEKRMADLTKSLDKFRKDEADGDGPDSSQRAPGAGSTTDTAPSGGGSITEDDRDANATKTKKSAGAAGDNWPDDLNDPTWQKTNKKAPADWGKDDESAPDPTK